MDPIHPIAPRPPAVLPVAPPRPERVSRERRERSPGEPQDRFTKQGRDQPDEEPPSGEPGAASAEADGPPHIDVRA